MAVDNAVHLGRVLGNAPDNGKLSSGTGTDNLLVANGRVVDQGGRVNVIDGALAGLVVGGEAP